MQHAIDNINAAAPWFFPVCVFAAGACIGSFLNVCIIRIPLGESVARPRSRCRACGAAIPWRFNMPIFGWLILRGRARCCGAAFSWRYPFVELLTALLFVACWQVFAPVSAAKALCGMVFASALVCATFTDIDHFQIPNVFTIGLAMAGVALSFAVPALHGQAHGFFAVAAFRSGLLGFAGMIAGSGLLLWIALVAEALLRKEAMGFQDVLFIGAIGAFCGWQGAVFSIFGGATLGAAWLLCALAWSGLRGKKITARPLDEGAPARELGLASHIPFGPMLAAGALLYFFWLHRWLDPRLADIARLLWR